MSSDDNLANDYHINANYQHSNIIPKVRPTTSSSNSSGSRKQSSVNAVPATPRMLRNSSGSFQQQQNQNAATPPLPPQPLHPNQRYPHDQLVSPQRSNSVRVQRTPSSAARYNQYQNSSNDHTPNSPSRQSLPPLDTHMAQNPQVQPQRTASQRNTPSRLLPPANVPNPMEPTSRRVESISSKPSKKLPQGQFHRKSIGEWDFMKTVGAGSMGKVKLAKHRQTSEVCAIKIVPRAARIYERNHTNAPPPIDDNEASKRIKEYEKEVARDRRTIREASLGKILYHPFICRLFEVITMSNHYYMLFEYVSGGQMLDYIVSHGSLKERHARKFARGIGSALDYLHKNNVVHRDLKIENIMISKTGDIKIIDFGLSNMYSNDSLLKTYCGSLYFAAPELLCAHPYIGPEVDVWSFGVVLYVLVCGKVPFDDQSVSSLHEKIKKGKVEYPSYLSPEVVSLLARMLVVNPNKRAKLSEVLSHPWMVKGYENHPLSFIPPRVPLTLPLDSAVIKEIYSLELGESEERITADLTLVITSDLYSEASKHWYQSQETSGSLRVDPTCGFHPLVSIYYLVDEMLKRRKAKQSVLDVPTPGYNGEEPDKQGSPMPLDPLGPSFQQVPQLTVETIPAKEQFQTPPQPPVLSFPETAHTSPIHSAAPPLADPQQILSSHTTAINEDSIISQQPHKQQPANGDEKGLNSLIRKFSQLRSKRSQEGSVQRTNSVNIPGSQRNNDNEYTLNTKYQGFGNGDSFQRVGSLHVPKTSFADTLKVDSQPGSNTGAQSKGHNRTVSAYTSGVVRPEILPSSKPISSQPTKKFHPSARAKSVGHRRDHPGFADQSNDAHQVPPLPSDLNDDTFFDDVTLDDFPNSDKITLVNSATSTSTTQRRTNGGTEDVNEDKIMEDANRAAPGTMPSIEFPRTLFLKGFFSVQTTSTKPLPVIRANIISVLTKLDVQFTEVRGGFICQHVPSIKPTELVNESTGSRSGKSSNDSALATVNASGDPNNRLQVPPTQPGADVNVPAETSFSEGQAQSVPVSTSKSTHKRKFSIGGSILGYRRKASVSGAPAMPPTPVAASNQFNQYDFDSSASLDSLNNGHGGHGGSDMLISSRIEQDRARAPSSPVPGTSVNQAHGHNTSSQSRTPLKFEIHVVKVPLVGLYGVQFKKVLGNTWMYKTLAGQILNELNL